MEEQEKPYIGSGIKLPETTVKAFILGVTLSVVLSGANAYLGLFAGMTVSASIPAAVISMALLKMFRESNILENNIVQTAASAGESLAAGVIFTFPALVIMGYWEGFNYLETALIALCGGVLGVMFTIPLRKALIIDMKLKFPEGVATSEVLKTGQTGGKGIKYLAIGGIIGALAKLFDSGFKLWDGLFAKATFAGQNTLVFFGLNLSPALLAVGYIVGFRIAFLIFLGGMISWWIAIPIYVAVMGIPAGADPIDLGYGIWSSQIRFLGVGAMVVGGLWALVGLRKTLGVALNAALASFKGAEKFEDVPRAERDTPMKWVIIAIGAMIVPIFIIYLREIQNVPITILMSLIMVIAGFLFASVAGYMAGLVGSSNNPISGVTIATILTSALILLALMGSGAEGGPVAAILIGSVVACAAAIAGDNMQDLKAGHILGATPFRLQIMQLTGVVAAAFTLPWVLNLLYTAYGFGPTTPENPDSLTAPQATLMASVADGVFGGGLPWTMVFIGAGIGILIIILDQIQAARGSDFRFPVLAVAVGLYLPFELDSSIMLGGIVALLVGRYQSANPMKEGFKMAIQRSNRSGLLFASGLITGEALLGILIALPIAIYESTDVLALTDESFGSLPGLIIILTVCYLLYRIAVKAYHRKEE
ncbi:MAG: OPT family oligopeptide transporter [Candidatus Cyclobacteriaceae bacterium M2_1C_046]